jgi:hypothetical protein
MQAISHISFPTSIPNTCTHPVLSPRIAQLLTGCITFLSLRG